MAQDRPASPYLKPGFYAQALAQGRHRDIIGGRWDETGRIHMTILQDLGLRPQDRVLDIGCGPLRTGCRLVPYLDAGNYWGTDLSGDLMRAGHAGELADADRTRLPVSQLIEDGDFAFPGVPGDLDVVICLAVLTHLPLDVLRHALARVAAHAPGFRLFLFSVFLAPDTAFAGPVRQPDGVVTHPDRAPWHFLASDVRQAAQDAGLCVTFLPHRMPRGQVLCSARQN